MLEEKCFHNSPPRHSDIADRVGCCAAGDNCKRKQCQCNNDRRHRGFLSLRTSFRVIYHASRGKEKRDLRWFGSVSPVLRECCRFAKAGKRFWTEFHLRPLLGRYQHLIKSMNLSMVSKKSRRKHQTKQQIFNLPFLIDDAHVFHSVNRLS
jgi:hypothetical protein